MANWLQTKLAHDVARTTNALIARAKTSLPTAPRGKNQKPATLPNATIIYGIGASGLFVAAFSLLLAGKWFSAIMVFILGGCLTGFALHLLKHQD